MRVLTDFHHADLFESFGLTLEDRLGYELYAPMGMDWYLQDYWEFEKRVHGDAVARQYLEGIWPDPVDKGTHFEQADKTHPGRIIKGLTVEQAHALRPDVVIATVTHNEAGLHRFATEANATFGVQLGNVGQAMEVNWNNARFALCSTTMLGFEPVVPWLIYRQEFSMQDFRYEYPPVETNSVSSFVQCFAENRGMERGGFYDQYVAFAEELRDEFDFRVYGSYGTQPEDHLACGNLPTTPDVAENMRRARIIWHAKFWSDGYGHVIHNAHAVGRPVLSFHNYYADKLAAPLMEHGVTGFDLNRMSADEITATLRRLRDDHEYHETISRATAKRFREVVDFDQDAENVRALLESVA